MNTNPERFLALISLLIVLAGCRQHQEDTTVELRSRIETQFSSTEGDFALAFVNLSDTSQTILINENEMFHAASTMKTPVMAELYRQAEAGKISLDDSLQVVNQFRSIVDSSTYQMNVSEDSEAALYQYIGQKRSIRNLIDDMITESSNLATNILIAKAGALSITQTMRSLGADSIRVLRGVEDIKAFERGLSNRTTARDLMILFRAMGEGTLVSPEASREMIAVLKRQVYNEMIPARLPDSVEVAHKTGWITGVHHDSGLVMLPDGRKYVLVLLSKEVDDRDEIVAMFADISRAIYDHVTEMEPSINPDGD